MVFRAWLRKKLHALAAYKTSSDDGFQQLCLKNSSQSNGSPELQRYSQGDISQQVSERRPQSRLSRELIEHLASNSLFSLQSISSASKTRSSRKRKFNEITEDDISTIRTTPMQAGSLSLEEFRNTPMTLPSTPGNDQETTLSRECHSQEASDKSRPKSEEDHLLASEAVPMKTLWKGVNCLNVIFKFCCGDTRKSAATSHYEAKMPSYLLYWESSQDSFQDDRFDHAADWLLQI